MAAASREWTGCWGPFYRGRGQEHFFFKFHEKKGYLRYWVSFPRRTHCRSIQGNDTVQANGGLDTFGGSREGIVLQGFFVSV